MPHSPASPELVEHFFRHESANLIAVLTRAFGVRHLDLVEDQVQEAMVTAMHTWGRRGLPDNPAGWIYRVARRKVLDVLRRDKIHQRAVALAGQSEEETKELVERWLEPDQLPDSLLRMIFVCSHPALDLGSQLGLILKVLCGFSLHEIARALLISEEAAKKRVQRAKRALAEAGIELELPAASKLHERLDAVHGVLYLLFNEGYSASKGPSPLRDDLCEEAARLTHLLCQRQELSTPETRALLALMLAHAARLDSRVDTQGAVVLLAEQDRSRWDFNLIIMASRWLDRAKTDAPSRYHFEAAIALCHCQASSFEKTPWGTIVRLYDLLLEANETPVGKVNRAIALGESGEVVEALHELEQLRLDRKLRGYFLLDCAIARLHELLRQEDRAREAYRQALEAPLAEHERALIESKLARLGVS